MAHMSAQTERELRTFEARCLTAEFPLFAPPSDSPADGIRRTLLQTFHDPDPRVRTCGLNFVDFASLRLLKQDSGLSPDFIDKAIAGYTRSTFVDTRDSGLLDRLASGILPAFIPPDCISSELIEQTLDFLVDKFGTFDGPVNYLEASAVSYPATHYAGHGYNGKPKGEVFTEACSRHKEMLRYWDEHGFSFSSIPRSVALTRTQMSEDSNPKIRLIWATTFHLLILQLRIWQPLYRAWLANPSKFSTFGFTLEDANEKVRRTFVAAKHDHNSAVCYHTDWPAFDVGKFTDLFGYVRGVTAWETMLITMFLFRVYHRNVIRNSRVLTRLLRYECLTSCFHRLSIGRWLWDVTELQASGDAGTYGRDTLVNAARTYIGLAYIKVVLLAGLFGGDDAIVVLAQTLDWEQLIAAFMKCFGTCWKPPPDTELFVADDEVYYHGHTATPSGPFRELVEIVRLLAYRERSDILDLVVDTPEARGHYSLALCRILALYYDSGRRFTFLLRMALALQIRYPGLSPAQVTSEFELPFADGATLFV